MTDSLFLNVWLLFCCTSKPDNCEEGTQADWLRLTSQWGTDESVPTKQAISQAPVLPAPNASYPLL